jgi:Tfp pilus assembly protein PilV
MMKRLKSIKGFSAVEFMLAVVIIVVVVMAMSVTITAISRRRNPNYVAMHSLMKMACDRARLFLDAS